CPSSSSASRMCSALACALVSLATSGGGVFFDLAIMRAMVRHSGMVRGTRPQGCNCTAGNLEIRGSMLCIAPQWQVQKVKDADHELLCLYHREQTGRRNLHRRNQ